MALASSSFLRFCYSQRCLSSSIPILTNASSRVLIYKPTFTPSICSSSLNIFSKYFYDLKGIKKLNYSLLVYSSISYCSGTYSSINFINPYLNCYFWSNGTSDKISLKLYPSPNFLLMKSDVPTASN
jgi:hypothetical protein